jgi:ribosomal protein S18 acetylase RimI-like enzyme
MGVGGKSTDLSLVSSSNNLLIGLYEKIGYNFTWMIEVTPAPAG